MIQFLRNLSHVSRDVRYELGVEFWKSTFIDANLAEFDDPCPILPLYALLVDRKAIWKEIKVLSLGISSIDETGPEKWAFEDEAKESPDHPDTEKYRFIAKSLHLDKLILEILVEDLEYQNLAAGAYPWFEIFRSFDVAKTFELKIKLLLSYDWHMDNPGDDEDEHRREMEEYYKPDVEDLITHA